MADTYLKMQYIVELSDKDMRIVGLALAGKLGLKEDREAARELSIRLLKAQQIRLHEQQTKIDGVLQRAMEDINVEKKEDFGIESGLRPKGPIHFGEE